MAARVRLAVRAWGCGRGALRDHRGALRLRTAHFPRKATRARPMGHPMWLPWTAGGGAALSAPKKGLRRCYLNSFVVQCAPRLHRNPTSSLRRVLKPGCGTSAARRPRRRRAGSQTRRVSLARGPCRRERQPPHVCQAQPTERAGGGPRLRRRALEQRCLQRGAARRAAAAGAAAGAAAAARRRRGGRLRAVAERAMGLRFGRGRGRGGRCERGGRGGCGRSGGDSQRTSAVQGLPCPVA
jgi:hypothetical protein